MSKINLRQHLKNAILGGLFAVLGVFGIATSPLLTTPVYAEPESSESTSVSENNDDTETCYDQVPGIGWLVCPTTGALGKAVDAIYTQIEKLLVVEPVSFEDSSPIYQIWQIMRDITNILFVIFLLVVIYSQITGLGISNYGIKKALPKLIVAAVLVNLSYLICALAVDASNIFGASIRGLFESIEAQAVNTGGIGSAADINWTRLTAALIGGGAVAGVAIIHFIWPLIAALLGAIISVLVGLVTLGLRQALITILVMIAPVAVVCSLLPNTEKWFKKWKDIFISMIIFYPMFSFLFGASQLAGWALIASALNSGSAFGLIVGMAVQVLPLILSIALMKMSGTVLGAVSSRLSNLANKPQEGIRANLAQRQELARLRRINNSALPSASLQRYLDKRARSRALDIENEGKIRAGRAEIYAQRKILGIKNYEPADIEQYKQRGLHTSVSTRAAKSAANISMAVKAAQDDTQHIIGEYGDFHHSTAADRHLAKQGAANFKEMNRAAFTLVNDDEADFNYLTGEYFKAANAGRDSYQYKHFIESSGGGLGEKGSTSVLGQLIAKTAANEARHRHDFAILGNKFNVDKRAFRNMVTGYYVNDDGLATEKPDPVTKKAKLVVWKDENGVGHEERYPGEFLYYHPEVLVPYDVRDENGVYFEMKDFNDNLITRIYRNDTPVMKEIFQNFDTVIQDPIDGLYGIMAGIKRGDIKELPDVGLEDLRTTIGRSIMGAKFKEKASFASPMYTTSVSKGYIQNFSHQFIERLQNITKTIRSGNFNQQDFFELQQLSALFDPKLSDNDWAGFKYLFPEDALRGYQDVNGKFLEGTILDKDGKKIGTVSKDDATYEQLLNTIRTKLWYPAAQAVAFMMSGATTPNVADNLKSGAAEAWGTLADNIKGWNSEAGKKAGLPNPFVRKTSVQNTAIELKNQINEASGFKTGRDKNTKTSQPQGKTAYSTDDPASSSTIVNAHISEPDSAEDLYLANLRERAIDFQQKLDSYRYAYLYDADGFREVTVPMFDDPEFEDVYQFYTDYIYANPSATTDDLYDTLTEYLLRFQ